MLKPLPSPLMKPILVFVNPKSGGNQVSKRFHLLESYFILFYADDVLLEKPAFHFLSSQGAKVLQMFMWILNPRQVFDLSQGGLREA